MSCRPSIASRNSTVRTRILRVAELRSTVSDDLLSVEEPLEILVKQKGLSLPMGVCFRTPGADENLALGLLYNEGVIASYSDVVSMKWKQEEDATLPATRLTVSVSEDLQLDTDRWQRALPISAACGACGKSALESLGIQREGPWDDQQGIRLSEKSLSCLPVRLHSAQEDFAATGGLHAVGVVNESAEVFETAEDIGRHNAMDKLTGSWLRSNQTWSWERSALLFSGRVGYDLMQKALRVGCPFVVSIGAPSSLAVELATLFNVTLVGFLRRDRFNVYSGPNRIQLTNIS